MTIRRIRRGLAEAVVDDSELGDELLAGLRFPVGRGASVPSAIT